PTRFSRMPGRPLFAVVFSACLVFAGLTSLTSIVQVPIQALRDQFRLGTRTSTIVVGGAMAIVSLLLMPTITGLYALDTMDAWANHIGIVGSAVLSIVVDARLLRK